MSLKNDPHRLVLANYPVRFTTRVLYSDMDAFRHVNNGATGRYFEEARASLSIRVFGVESLINPPEGLIVLFAGTVMDYLAQAYYPGEVEIGSAITKIGTSSFTQAQAAFQGGKCFALAQAAMVKSLHGKAEPLTEAERAAMRGLMLGEAT
jgi:acyl-CoA thioester hydrolase